MTIGKRFNHLDRQEVDELVSKNNREAPINQNYGKLNKYQN